MSKNVFGKGSGIVLGMCLLFCAVLLSCSKDSGPDAGTFEVTYTLRGPATAAQVYYTPTIRDVHAIPEGYEETVTTPWQKTVTLIDAVRGAGFSVSMSNGQPGARYQMAILNGDGDTVESGEFVLDSEGRGSALLNYYR